MITQRRFTKPCPYYRAALRFYISVVHLNKPIALKANIKLPNLNKNRGQCMGRDVLAAIPHRKQQRLVILFVVVMHMHALPAISKRCTKVV